MKMRVNEHEKDLVISYYGWRGIQHTIAIYDKATDTLEVLDRGVDKVEPMIKALSRWADGNRTIRDVKVVFRI